MQTKEMYGSIPAIDRARARFIPTTKNTGAVVIEDVDHEGMIRDRGRLATLLGIIGQCVCSQCDLFTGRNNGATCQGINLRDTVVEPDGEINLYQMFAVDPVTGRIDPRVLPGEYDTFNLNGASLNTTLANTPCRAKV